MQLLAVILYNSVGDQRLIEFEPGALNVVTGVSATGKSALLDIVEFCLGRSTVVMPVGPITQTVTWYALMLEHDDTRVFVARPAPRPGAASTQRAMIEFGTELEALPFERLDVNADAATVREQLGRLIGIDENAGEASSPWTPDGLEANLGHAVLLCLQRQGEIANREFLFHRQGEEGMKGAIQDTLPYFLGAIPRDQAVQRQRLLAARRDLRRALADLDRAQAINEDIDVRLLAVVREAVGEGLLPEREYDGRAEMFAALDTATTVGAPEPALDEEVAARREGLQRERTDLRIALRAAGEQAALLRSIDDDEDAYGEVLDRQISRLSSIGLLGDASDADVCPVCEQHLPDEDATIEQLRTAVAELTSQLEGVEAVRPRRREALQQVSSIVDSLREKLRATETALNAMAQAEDKIQLTSSVAERQAFTRGRIQYYLESAVAAAPEELSRLADLVRVRTRAVEALEQRLDPDEMREQLAARLAIVAADMTAYSQHLQLEHTGAVWLDVTRLTVMADTNQGPAPLFRIGSAENWIGYHLIAHLALHRYFVRQRRPVPGFLMLDQPTQAYYPSDVEQQEGVPEGENDRAAVRRMFELMRDVADELAPGLQIIVCDHANLPEEWFQDAVRHNWRNGEKLIPAEWLPAAE